MARRAPQSSKSKTVSRRTPSTKGGAKSSSSKKRVAAREATKPSAKVKRVASAKVQVLEASAPSVATDPTPKEVVGTIAKPEIPRVVISPVDESVPAVRMEDRSLSPEELSTERDRIYARLTAVPNVTSRPSPADYVVFEVADPDTVLRKLVNSGIPPEAVQKYAKIPNGMRVVVRSARKNEDFLRALEQSVK